MERLNYFNPYISKSSAHEDQLTRAYLVLMRHSFHTFILFYDYCRSQQLLVSEKDEPYLSLFNMLEGGYEIATQLSNPSIGTDWLLSVLITDNELTNYNTVAASDRNARYDGYIQFGDQLTIIIENKPRSQNVWFGQLNPAKTGLSEETKVFTHPVLLQWKEIIRHLSQASKLPSISGYEKIMIDDFFSMIDQQFPFLNPYDHFHLCKGHEPLIQRRIQTLLKTIVSNEERVKYHYGWGYSIITGYDEIKEIGLIYHKDDAKGVWWLELSLFFGDTQSQARNFYNANPSLKHLSDEDWDKFGNFHVSFRSSNLVYFRNVPNLELYISFWKENTHLLRQQQKEEVYDFLTFLQNKNIISISQEEKEELDDRFYSTNMSVLNICPGLSVVFTVTGQEAEALDRTDQLKRVLSKAIMDGLKIINKDGSEFLHHKYL